MTDEENKNYQDSRRKRVERLKKIIRFCRRAGYILPWVVVLLLAIRIHALRTEVIKTREQLQEYGEENERLNFEIGKIDQAQQQSAIEEDSKDKLDQIILNDQIPMDFDDLSLEELYDGYRKVYLTFDDGPSSNTDAILDILKEYDVKATFFVIYKSGRDNEALYRRIVDEGHSIGMHSCTHEYSVVYAGKEEFWADTKKLQDLLYMVTGVQSTLYRFPGGSSNKVSSIDMREFGKILKDNGISYHDWNISSQDASKPIPSKNQIFANVTKDLENYSQAVVLMHDTASKVTTVEALPEIIEYIQSMEKTVILPITEETNPIQHIHLDD
ncbi:MAG: polysaccharide deacetylase [Lachnospiraceae bacterium]|nr:polysaccharide deacetylase [Lachnospiraceae bacterium]